MFVEISKLLVILPNISPAEIFSINVYASLTVPLLSEQLSRFIGSFMDWPWTMRDFTFFSRLISGISGVFFWYKLFSDGRPFCFFSLSGSSFIGTIKDLSNRFKEFSLLASEELCEDLRGLLIDIRLASTDERYSWDPSLLKLLSVIRNAEVLEWASSIRARMKSISFCWACCFRNSRPTLQVRFSPVCLCLTLRHNLHIDHEGSGKIPFNMGRFDVANLPTWQHKAWLVHLFNFRLGWFCRTPWLHASQKVST